MFKPLLVLVMFLAALLAVVEIKSEEVTVTRVVDGDTIEVSNGETVRVAVIDSCELFPPRGPTPGGIAAKADAETLLDGQRVTLVRRGARERDDYERLLRVVILPDGRDYGRVMVGSRHTQVYQGRIDAFQWYIDEVRRDDPNGAVC